MERDNIIMQISVITNVNCFLTALILIDIYFTLRSGFIGPSICFDSWDHAYACVEDGERKSDPKPAITIQSPPPESTSNCPEAKGRIVLHIYASFWYTELY